MNVKGTTITHITSNKINTKVSFNSLNKKAKRINNIPVDTLELFDSAYGIKYNKGIKYKRQYKDGKYERNKIGEKQLKDMKISFNITSISYFIFN